METKEKFERAKRLYETANADQKYVLERLFPELAESEDERIRKHLIGVVELYYGNTDEQEKKDCLAWLEKQGKNNMGISEETKKELEDNLNKALEKETPESCNEFLEKQDKQKPAWSEDELKVLNEIIEDYEKANKSFGGYQARIYWLKSLRDRVLPQQKQAWSEEDERNLDWLTTVCERIHYKSDPQVAPECALILRDWLDSLKDRYTWKPSDEQMDALHYVTNFDYGGYKAILVSLYEQLKKLRKE